MAASSAAPSEELQRPEHGGDQQSEPGRVLRAAVVPREAPAAEAPHAEAETGEQESPSEEEQPAPDSTLVHMENTRCLRTTDGVARARRTVPPKTNKRRDK